MGNLRAYFFQNMYLTGIHAGIQSQHTTTEMFLKYEYHPKTRGDILYNWASNHKTAIVLNGGYASNLEGLIDFLNTEDNPFPWAYFRESEDALGGCVTNVGIILPERVYGYQPQYVPAPADRFHSDLSDWEYDMFEELRKCRLMS